MKLNPEWHRGGMGRSGVVGRVLTGDEFIDHRCVRCYSGAALFVFEGRYVALCPSCVVERIVRLRRRGWALPESLGILEEEACREVRYQESREQQRLSVRFDGLLKCPRCGHVVQDSDVRYYFEPGSSVGHGHCIDCHTVLTDRRSEY